MGKRLVPDSQSDFKCKSDCFLTSDLAELADGLRQGWVHQNACRITQISDFNNQWEASQISQMTSQPMGIEDFLVIDGAMSQQNFPEYSIPFYQSHQKHKWRVRITLKYHEKISTVFVLMLMT